MDSIHDALSQYNEILDNKFNEAQINAHTQSLKGYTPSLVSAALIATYDKHGTKHKPTVEEIKNIIHQIVQRQHEERKQTERKDQRSKEQIILEAEREDTRETIKQCRHLLQLKLDGIINLDELKQKLVVVTGWDGT